MAQAQRKQEIPGVIDLEKARKEKEKKRGEDEFEVSTDRSREGCITRMLWDEKKDKFVIEDEENGKIIRSNPWTLDQVIRIFKGSALFERALGIPLFAEAVVKAEKRMKEERIKK